MAAATWHGVVGDEASWRVQDPTVAIRAAVADDAVALFEYGRMPEGQEFVSRVVHSPQEARDLLENQRADEHAARCVIEADGRIVGDIGGRFYHPDSLGQVPEVWDFYLGFTVHPQFWGRGIATAAVGLFVPLLHDRLGVRRIVAKVFEDNQASARVLGKQGFRQEGREVAAVLGRDGAWLTDLTFAHLV